MIQKNELAASSPLEGGEERRSRYNRGVRRAHLAGLFLESVDFKVLPDAIGAKDLKRSYEGSIERLHFDHEKGFCAATISWKIEARFGRKKVIRCAARYVILYNQLSDFDEELARVFVESVGQPATYAYFRALYASLDWSANLNSPPLPMIKFQPKV